MRMVKANTATIDSHPNFLCFLSLHLDTKKEADFQFFYHINRNHDEVIFNSVHNNANLDCMVQYTLCFGQVVLISRFHLSFSFSFFALSAYFFIMEWGTIFSSWFFSQKVDWFYLQMKLASMTTNFIMKDSVGQAIINNTTTG